MTTPTPAGTRGKSRDPVRTRAALLLAAREEFEIKGLSGARTSTIAKRAGVPQGLIYHYFESKSELFRAVMDEAMVPYFTSTIDMLESAASTPSLGLIEQAIRTHFDFLRRNPHIPRLFTWWRADQSPLDGPLFRDETSLCARPYELGAELIRRGQAEGVLRPDLDPILVISSFLGLSMEWHSNEKMHCDEHGVSPDDRPSLEELRDRALEHIVNMVLHGVAAVNPVKKTKEIQS